MPKIAPFKLTKEQAQYAANYVYKLQQLFHITEWDVLVNVHVEDDGPHAAAVNKFDDYKKADLSFYTAYFDSDGWCDAEGQTKNVIHEMLHLVTHDASVFAYNACNLSAYIPVGVKELTKAHAETLDERQVETLTKILYPYVKEKLGNFDLKKLIAEGESGEIKPPPAPQGSKAPDKEAPDLVWINDSTNTIGMEKALNANDNHEQLS